MALARLQSSAGKSTFSENVSGQVGHPGRHTVALSRALSDRGRRSKQDSVVLGTPDSTPDSGNHNQWLQRDAGKPDSDPKGAGRDPI